MEHLVVLAAVLVLVQGDAFPIQNPVVPFPLQDKIELMLVLQRLQTHSCLDIPNTSAENLHGLPLTSNVHSPVYLHRYGATASLSSLFHWISSYSV